jgi:hypothetical protein
VDRDPDPREFDERSRWVRLISANFTEEWGKTK